MSILGSLIVELKANTASFIDGLSGAAKTSRTVGREIESSFSNLGSVAATALAPFGQIGFAISQTLEKIGSSAGGAIVSMGKMGGAIGTVGAIGAGAAAAMSAVSLGSIALAAHTAESIAKMGELAQSTGVSVQALSGLSFVGKQVGVDTETMAKSLEKMSKSAFAAATAPANAVNAYTRLGVSVRDASGNIRSTTDIFTDLAGKFAAMPDGVTKTALAIQIFGRGGAEIIPVLNRGKEGINELLNTAQSLGIVLDTQTVQASQAFKEALATMGAAGEGLSIQLTKQLLPAMQTVATFLIDGFKDKASGLNDLISGFAFVTKAVLVTGETIWAVFKQIGIAIGDFAALLIESIASAGKVTFDLATGNFSAVVADAKDSSVRMKAVISTFIDSSKSNWKSFADFRAGLFAPLPAAKPSLPGGGPSVDLKPAKEDTTLDRIRERIKALQQETVDWANVAAAGTQAEALVAEAVKKGNEEFGKLRAEAAKDKTGRALPFVLQNEDVIRAAGAESVFGAAIKSLTGDLDKQQLKLIEQGKAAIALGSAYQQGGTAIANAALGVKFADQSAKLDVLVEAQGILAARLGKDNPIVLQLAAAVSKLTMALQDNEDAARKAASAELSAELDKQSHSFAVLKPYMDTLNNAYMISEDAVRRARIELELYRWTEEQLGKGIVVTTAQKEQERKILEDADRQAYEGTLKQEAARYSLGAIYDSEITKLRRLREVIQENGSSTLLIDARLHDAEDSLIHQWDEAAFKVGSFSDKFKGIMGELAIQGRAAGAAISQAFLGAIDSIETNLAKLLTGQKTNFKQVIQNLAEQVTKAEIQKGVGALASQFGIKLPGAKADGSTESLALWVRMAGGSIAGGKGGGAGDILSQFSSLFGGGAQIPGTGQSISELQALGYSNSEIASLLGSGGFGGFGGGGMGGMFGGFLSGIGKLFGGFLAGGGDMTPGKWYVAGEKGPEIVKGPGSVTPMSYGDRGHQTSIVNNFNGLKDNDMFRRSTSQMVAYQHRQMSIAYSRS